MRNYIAAAVSLIAVAACSDPIAKSGTGRTQVLLTDGPFPYDRIARVDVHIVRVQVAASPDTLAPQAWTTVVEPNRTINILDLQSGKTTLLGETEVNAGTVGAVRVVINTALSSVKDNAGNAVTVHWPVQGELTMNAYVQSSLASFVEGTAHNLVIDFDVGRSFEDVLGDGTLWFIPWIRALDDAGAGSVSGVIRGPVAGSADLQPLPNVAVTVLSGSPSSSPLTWWKVATGRTDANGRYKVAYLLQGSYIVRAEPLSGVAGCRDSANVVVANGTDTGVEFTLTATDLCARHTSSGGGPDSAGTGTGTTGGGGPDTTATPDAPVATVSVTVWPASPAVNDSIGAYANLASAAGASLYNRAVTWTVSDTTVLRVTGIFGQSLMLRAKKAGTVTITAVSEGVTGMKSVTVH